MRSDSHGLAAESDETEGVTADRGAFHGPTPERALPGHVSEGAFHGPASERALPGHVSESGPVPGLSADGDVPSPVLSADGDVPVRTVVVGAAIVRRGRVLACQRLAPPETAGGWEFPGGKVDPGETEHDALVRECEEELGVRVAIGARIGPDVPLAGGRAALKVWLARLLEGEPQPLEHGDLRWLAADELHTVPWLPGDLPIVATLATTLETRTP